MGDRVFRSNLFVRGTLDAEEILAGGVPVLPGGGSSGLPLTNGEIFYVDSGHANASDNNTGQSPDRPLATIDAAIGKCTANRGDVVLCAPGHAETVSAAAGIDLDVAGVSLVGMSQGDLRPTITFDTDAAADLDVDAADCLIDGFLFVNDIDSQTAMIDVNADDCTIRNCEFREGSSKQALTFIDVNGGSANACDRVKVQNCMFYQTAAGGAQAIELGEVADEVKIVGNLIYGDFSAAGIHNPTGKVLTDLLIAGNYIRNLNSGNHAIELVSACTGLCVDNRLFADAAATVLDPGSLLCTNNLAQIAVDKPGFLVPLTEEDVVTNAIGVDDADNAYASTNVAANEDGSVLERLEQIQEATNKGSGTALAANESLVDVLYGTNGIGTFPASAAPANNVSIAEVLRDVWDVLRNGTGGSEPPTNTSIVDVVLGSASSGQSARLGTLVQRAAADILDGTTTNLFTVSGGRVLITQLMAEVSGAAVDATNSNLRFVANPTTGSDVNLCADLDVISDEEGTMYSIAGAAATALQGGTAGAALGMTTNGVIVNAGTIDSVSSADAGTGGALLSVDLWYIPLDPGASVATA